MLKIVVLDFTSDKNRGDAALHIGLLRLVEKYFDHPQITAVSLFGSNQRRYFSSEHDQIYQSPYSFLGGLKPTFYPMDKSERHILTVELMNAFSLLFCLFPLLLAFFKLPVGFLSLFFSAEARKALHAIHNTDLVIWNRRNLRSRDSHILEIYRTLNILFHPLLAIALGKPIAVAGSSLWEMKSGISRFLVQFVMNHLFYISFREENSYIESVKLLPRIEPDRIRLLPDLSFAALDNLDHILKSRKPLSLTNFPQIMGITLVDWESDGQDARDRYIHSIVETIRYFMKVGSYIKVIPQVTKKWEGYRKILADIYSRLTKEESQTLEILADGPTVSELVQIYSQLDFLIATRMHSAIFALSVQTPVAAVSYDSGGKWAILDGLGYGEYIIPFVEVTPEKLLGKVNEVWADKDRILDVVGRRVEEHMRDVDLNVSLMAEYYWTDFGIK